MKCSDISGANCSYIAHGQTAEETKKDLFEHGMRQHPWLMIGICASDKKKMMKMIDLRMSAK